MSYEIEVISEKDWENIRESSDILRATTARPNKRAVNHMNSNFLVEFGNNDNRVELFRRCVFVTSSRSVFINLSDANTGKYELSWEAWDGIQESEIASLNEKLVGAFVALYGVHEDSLVQNVTHNLYLEIPKDTLLYKFDTQIYLWYGSIRNHIMNRYTDELINLKTAVE
jgi:hypothetical protein